MTNNQFCDKQPIIQTNNHQSRQTTNSRDKQLTSVFKTNNHSQDNQPVIETNNHQSRKTTSSREKQLLPVIKKNNRKSRQTTINRDKQLMPVFKTNKESRQTGKQPVVETNSFYQYSRQTTINL